MKAYHGPPKYSTAIAVAEKATVATCSGLAAGIAAVAGVDGMAAQNANKTTHGEDTKDDNHEAYMVGIYLYTLMCVSTVHSVLYRVLWKKGILLGWDSNPQPVQF